MTLQLIENIGIIATARSCFTAHGVDTLPFENIFAGKIGVKAIPGVLFRITRYGNE